jgi:hypothetical protein
VIDVLCFRANKDFEIPPWRAVKAMSAFAAWQKIGLEELKDVDTFICMAKRVDEKEYQEETSKQLFPDSKKNCSHFNSKVFFFRHQEIPRPSTSV